MRILIRSIEGFLKSRVVWMVTEWVARVLSIRQRCRPDHAEFVICDHTIDISYVRLQAEFVCLAVLIDVYTRSLRGWHLARSLDHH
jgi:transposase InsO family protein